MISKKPRRPNKIPKHYIENMKIEKQIICTLPKIVGNNIRENAVNTLAKEETVKRKILNNYLECTSIHGLQYFGKVSIEVKEIGKFIWSCTMIIGFICSTLMVIRFWHRYNDNPANTYVKSFHAPIFNAFFPAVTLCPFAKPLLIRRQKLVEQLRLPANMSKEEAMFLLKYVYTLSRPQVIERYQYLEKLQALLNINELNLADLMKMTRPCSDVVESCWWHGYKLNNCSKYFRFSHTSRGVCCSFNYILEENIKHEINMRKPRFIFNAAYGPESGLKVILKRDILLNDNDTDSLSRMETNSDGITVGIHHANDYLSEEAPMRLLQANKELQLSVVPTLYKKPKGFDSTDENGKTVPLCVPNNGALKYFRTYRFSSCYAECRINAMINTCGCLPYNYEPVARYYGIKNCELVGLTCIRENAKHFRIVKNVYTHNFTCSCRQPCYNIVYDITPIDCTIREKHLNLSPLYQGVSEGQAILRVYMGSQVFTKLETLPRDGIYLLSSVGGIFSLFLGCSFISAVEILYFCGLLYRSNLTRRKSSTHFQDKQTYFIRLQNTMTHLK